VVFGPADFSGPRYIPRRQVARVANGYESVHAVSAIDHVRLYSPRLDVEISALKNSAISNLAARELS
jgi:hypothetical protein